MRDVRGGGYSTCVTEKFVKKKKKENMLGIVLVRSPDTRNPTLKKGSSTSHWKEAIRRVTKNPNLPSASLLGQVMETGRRATVVMGAGTKAALDPVVAEVHVRTASVLPVNLAVQMAAPKFMELAERLSVPRPDRRLVRSALPPAQR